MQGLRYGDASACCCLGEWQGLHLAKPRNRILCIAHTSSWRYSDATAAILQQLPPCRAATLATLATLAANTATGATLRKAVASPPPRPSLTTAPTRL